MWPQGEIIRSTTPGLSRCAQHTQLSRSRHDVYTVLRDVRSVSKLAGTIIPPAAAACITAADKQMKAERNNR